MNDKVTILDVPFSTYSLEQTVEVLVQSVQIDRSKPFHLITGNPEIVLKNQEDLELRQIIADADLITPDGEDNWYYPFLHTRHLRIEIANITDFIGSAHQV